MADRYLVECDRKPCCDYGTNDYHFKDAQIVKLRPDQVVVWEAEYEARKYNAKRAGREEGLKDGHTEAWELAQKILRRAESGGYSIDELRQAFDITEVVPDRTVPGVCILQESFDTALAGLKEIELKKNKQLDPGDLVRVHSGNNHYDGRLALVVAIRKYNNEHAYKVVFDDGDVSLYTRDAVDYIRTVGFEKFFSEEEEEENDG